MADFNAELAPSPSTLFAPLAATTSSHNAEIAVSPISAFFPLGASVDPCGLETFQLAAYDASGRRYWTSMTYSFASAPIPVGAWNVSTLTIMAILS